RWPTCWRRAASRSSSRSACTGRSWRCGPVCPPSTSRTTARVPRRSPTSASTSGASTCGRSRRRRWPRPSGRWRPTRGRTGTRWPGGWAGAEPPPHGSTSWCGRPSAGEVRRRAEVAARRLAGAPADTVELVAVDVRDLAERRARGDPGDVTGGPAVVGDQPRVVVAQLEVEVPVDEHPPDVVAVEHLEHLLVRGPREVGHVLVLGEELPARGGVAGAHVEQEIGSAAGGAG